jgi:DNA-binding NtrC family response regulator
MTAHGSINTAVDAMRGGAYDFLVKPFTADRLTVTVKNALERQHLAKTLENLKDDFSTDKGFCSFVGSSLPMQAVYRILDTAAQSKATVFVTGESGTGKELCAEAVHKRSPRKKGSFVAINCGAIPKDLMESEIFGHVKGAFTGAVSDRDGAASRADGGTLFLDEICEMDMSLQTKLLRFIQTGTFSKVGSDKVEKVDTRFVCATNRDPLKEVEDGNFREDLYYRLHVIPVMLPPLRERDGDVIELARFFLKEFTAEEGKDFTGFDNHAEHTLRHYHWPGNVRQLQNVVRNAVVLNVGTVLTKDMLPPPLNTHQVLRAPHDVAAQPVPSPEQSAEPAPAAPAVDALQGDDIRPLWIVEKEVIEHAIALCDGNIPRAAAALEISPSTIYRKKMSWDGVKE